MRKKEEGDGKRDERRRIGRSKCRKGGEKEGGMQENKKKSVERSKGLRRRQ